MKEIGGYFELQRFSGESYHKDAIALNCGRACFAYLVELRGIQKIWVPDFMCASVPALLNREGVKVLTYPIGIDMLPDYTKFMVSDDEWLLLADYYGQLRRKDVSRALAESGGNLIVDETQGFFRAPWVGADTVYSCRKWFGVADGGYLVTSDGARLVREIPQDESHARMGFVLGRFERPASEFYEESSGNNDFFANEPTKRMSPITENLMRVIDYELAKNRRDSNWDILAEALSEANLMNPLKPDGAFMYPFMTTNAQTVRQKLIAGHIYVPCLWPNILRDVYKGSIAQRFAELILPLPLDQRYGEAEMRFVVSVVLGALEEKNNGE